MSAVSTDTIDANQYDEASLLALKLKTLQGVPTVTAKTSCKKPAKSESEFYCEDFGYKLIRPM